MRIAPEPPRKTTEVTATRSASNNPASTNLFLSSSRQGRCARTSRRRHHRRPMASRATRRATPTSSRTKSTSPEMRRRRDAVRRGDRRARIAASPISAKTSRTRSRAGRKSTSEQRRPTTASSVFPTEMKAASGIDAPLVALPRRRRGPPPARGRGRRGRARPAHAGRRPDRRDEPVSDLELDPDLRRDHVGDEESRRESPVTLAVHWPVRGGRRPLVGGPHATFERERSMSASWFSGSSTSVVIVRTASSSNSADSTYSTTTSSRRGRPRRERLELLLLEVAVGELSVAVELVLVRKLGVADLEVVRGRLVDASAARDGAERAPGDEGPDRPREVVVEAHERDVGRRVRIVDQGRLIALDDHLAGVELPAEERVDEPADRLHLAVQLGREEVGLGAVAVVPVGGQVVPGDERLRPIERLRVNTSKSSTEACTCISRSPECSYAKRSSSGS